MNLADTRPFPRLIRKVAEQIMKSSYNDAVKNLRAGPEAGGLRAHRARTGTALLLGPLGIDDVTKTIAVAVIDARGDLVGVYQGEDAQRAGARDAGARGGLAGDDSPTP